MFKGTKYKLSLWLLLLICSIALSVYFAMRPIYTLLPISLPFVVASIYGILQVYTQNVRKMMFMFNSIANGDYSFHFTEYDGPVSDNLLNMSLNRIKELLTETKLDVIQKERYYELILDSVTTGVLVINDNGSVYQTNNEMLKLMGLPRLTHISQLAQIDTQLPALLHDIASGEKRQFSFTNERGTINLSLQASAMEIKGKKLRIIAINDINSELDEKEIESWIKLIRVLTHEIMNSITPIVSLSETLMTQATLLGKESDATSDATTASSSAPASGLTPPVASSTSPSMLNASRLTPANSPITSDLDSPQSNLHRGLSVIHATSKGLMSFVETYRKFTRIPTPEKQLLYVEPLLRRAAHLIGHEHPGVPFTIQVEPSELIVHADENLIGQVVVNLLKNAAQAVEDRSDGAIVVSACIDAEERVIISVSDNGPGIAPEIAPHIFVPFFTTKKHGTGIGLSLSRQIMRLHNGSLVVRSSPSGTLFSLIFQ